jgi:hypothetical protein
MRISQEESKKELTVQVNDDLSVTIMQDPTHEFLMSTQQVAQSYDVSDSVIRDHKRKYADELIEGKHWFSSVYKIDAGNLSTKRILWTKRGVVRLGFFIKSGRAMMIRDWAENYLVGVLEAQETQAMAVQRPTVSETLPLLRDGSVDREAALKVVQEAIEMIRGGATGFCRLANINNRTFYRYYLEGFEGHKTTWRIIYKTAYDVVKSTLNPFDAETVELLLKVEDKEVRMGLFHKLQKGNKS